MCILHFLRLIKNAKYNFEIYPEMISQGEKGRCKEEFESRNFNSSDLNRILKGVFPIWVPVSHSLSRIWTIATAGIVAKLVYYRVRMMGKLKDGVNPLILAIQSGARSRSSRW